MRVRLKLQVSTSAEMRSRRARRLGSYFRNPRWIERSRSPKTCASRGCSRICRFGRSLNVRANCSSCSDSINIAPLAARLEPRLGPCLADGDVAMFRWAEEDATELIKLQSELEVDVRSWKVRRPNLNDVFLWVAAGKGLRS